VIGRFTGRDIIAKPSCPFCGMLIEKPQELDNRRPQEMPVGKCSCGAVYAFDVTGHNLGTAMIEALVFGCKGDWDLAWGLLPEEDYLEKEVTNYDLETHLIVHSGAYQGRQINGTLYFIKLHQDVLEVTEEGSKRLLESAAALSKQSSPKKRGRKSFSKKEIEKLVYNYQIAPLIDLADEDHRIIRDLKRLLYSVDKLQRSRAAEAMGKVAAQISLKDPGIISRLLQGLFTALSDTAASSWGYIETIGEIIKNNPKQFAGYLPQIYQFTRDKALLPDVLKALANISESFPNLVRKNTMHFIPLLNDPNAEIRGYAVLLIKNLRAKEAEDDLKLLLNDQAEIDVYHDGNIESLSIGQLASEALEGQ
jgi:hypothetical protein